MKILLLPVLWLFMLLDWIYKKIKFYCFSAEQESQGQQEICFPAERQTTETQGDALEQPKQKPATDDGMESQERTLQKFTFKKPSRKRIKRKAQDKTLDMEMGMDSR